MARLVVSTFHSLAFEGLPTVSPTPFCGRVFEELVKAAARSGHLLSATDVAALRTRDALSDLLRTSDRDFHLFTFDDGYVEHLRAAEILEEYGAAGVFFVPSSVLSGEMLLVNKIHLLHRTYGSMDKVVAALEMVSGMRLFDRLLMRGRDLLNRIWKGTFDSDVDKALKVALQQDAQDEPLASILHQATEVVLKRMGLEAQGYYLDRSGLRALVAAGSIVGGHGATHRRLTELSESERAAELSASKRLVEEYCSTDVLHFAYPFGSYNAAIEDSVVNSDFDILYTIEEGVNLEDSYNPFRVQRVDAIRLHDFI